MPQYIYYQWKQYPVPIQYSLPKWMNAAEAGVLIDGSADSDDVLSLIYEWERKNFIKIDDNWENINFSILKELPPTAKPYEKTLFTELFSDQKININRIRLEVLDYCFKMGWIYDPFWGEIWEYPAFLVAVCIIATIFLFFSVIWIPIGIILIIALCTKLNKPHYISNSTLHLYLWANPQYLPKCKYISEPLCVESYSTTPLTEKWKLLQSHLIWYQEYLDKVKITTRTDKVNDGTLSDRVPLGINYGGDIINSIKKHKVNKKEYSYDILFEKKIEKWMANWEKEHNCKLYNI